MTIDELNEQVKKAQAELRRTRKDETFRIASDVLALVKSRVINTGKDNKGGNFTPYSRAVVPYWYHGSSYLRSGRQTDFDIRKKQRELLNKVGYFATYPDWRAINNRRSAFKNFSFTNRMWHRIRAVLFAQYPDITRYDLRADNAEDQRILKAHNAREKKDLTALNAAELARVARLHRQRVIRILNKFGLTTS